MSPSPSPGRPRHFFTVDVEEYFQVVALAPYAPMDRWSTFESRVERSVDELLALMATYGVTGTFFTVGWVAERQPAMMRRIVAAGHEIAHHGYMHESLQGVSPETEARWFDRGMEAIERVAGVRPVGYRAPMWEPSWYTPQLLHERGLLYDSSLMDADTPYELAVGHADAARAVRIAARRAGGQQPARGDHDR